MGIKNKNYQIMKEAGFIEQGEGQILFSTRFQRDQRVIELTESEWTLYANGKPILYGRNFEILRKVITTE